MLDREAEERHEYPIAGGPAPEPLEAYIQHFDPLFTKRNQREAFRRYLEGLLLPAERNKTLTALANTEPVVGAQHRQAQRLQWFLSESTWDSHTLNRRRLDLLRADPTTAPDDRGVLVIDETGDRKDGHKTAHVGRQYLANLGKTDNGVVSVSSLWADERVYYPLEVEPYTPAHWFARGKADPAFRTKPQIALTLVQRAVAEQWPFRAVVADSFYGGNPTFRMGLNPLKVGYVLGAQPSHCWWHPDADVGSLAEVAEAAVWAGPEQPGAWEPVVRTFRDGHAEVGGPWRWSPAPMDQERTARHRGHDRSAPVAGGDDVVSAHQSPRPWGVRGSDEPAGTGEPGRDRAAVWLAHVGGAELQAGEPCVGLGRVSSAERCSDAAPLGAGVVCVFVLLVAAGARRGGGTRVAGCAGGSAASGWAAHDSRGGKKNQAGTVPQRPRVCWPVALRLARAWLEPWIMLRRYWRAWSPLPPPPALQALLAWVQRGFPLYLYEPL